MTDSDIRAPHLRKGDFLGAFAVVERGGLLLMVQNERHIGGRVVRTWDLPGGQVEPGELLHEALVRELHEETGLRLAQPPGFLFVQEGERVIDAQRSHAWRSFFFACEALGDPRAGAEVLAVRWFAREELLPELVAPYHDSFRQWLAGGGRFFGSRWSDVTT